ncbi:hypothetical protein LTR29_016132 [Friedmanniomyces endolithicus]|nr:hypothetical protein LTR29_016132 [Friedmanniomyces endolithicus]
MAGPTDFVSDSVEELFEKRAAEEAADSSAEQASLSKSIFTQSLEVVVGETKTKFFVHSRIITQRSPFFDAALKRWKTAGEPVTLSDDEPATFDAYLEFLYFGRITSLDAVKDHDARTRFLLKLYILTDKLGDLRSANSTIDQLADILWNSVPDLTEVLPAWSSTPSGSPLRVLLIDTLPMFSDPRELMERVEDDDVPKDLAVALARRLGAFVGIIMAVGSPEISAKNPAFSKLVPMGDHCKYHQHDASHPRCKGASHGGKKRTAHWWAGN